MKTTGAQFAEMQSRAGQGDGEDRHEGAATRQETAQPANEQRKRTSEPLIEKIEEGPVTTGKEAPEQGNTTEESTEDGPVSVLETALHEEAETDLAPEAKPQQNPSRAPSAPRKNVIPSRRTSLENGQRASFAASKNGRLASNVQDSPQTAPDSLST